MRRSLAVLALTWLLTACGAGAATGAAPAMPLPGRATITFHTAEGPVTLSGIEVAETDAERVRGLMGRERLVRNGGMLFVFQGRVREPFWMKNTLIPLSIAFWDEDGTIVRILDMKPCDGNPCPLYDPGVPYVAALEMGLGAFGRLGVTEGDAVEVELP